MRSLKIYVSGGRAARLALASCCVLIVLAFAFAALAQSGRRQPKREEVKPIEVSTPTPTPAPTPEPLPKTKLLVLTSGSFSMDVSSRVTELVQQVFGQRLRESGAFDVSADSRNANRGEANKRAKAETERYVVWAELRSNNFGGNPMGLGRARAEDFRIEYMVLAPATGKLKSSGSVYLRQVRGTIGGVGVGVGVPSCYPATYASDYGFVVGAVEAANRVMGAFDVPPPPMCR